MGVMGLFSKDDIITSSKHVRVLHATDVGNPTRSMAEDSNLPTCYFLATSGTKTYEGEYHWATGRWHGDGILKSEPVDTHFEYMSWWMLLFNGLIIDSHGELYRIHDISETICWFMSMDDYGCVQKWMDPHWRPPSEPESPKNQAEIGLFFLFGIW